MRRYVLVALLILGIPMAAQGGSGLASFKACQFCHADIFELWKHSLHSQSYSDPPFQAAYIKLMLQEGGDAVKTCLRCHAPAAFIARDFDLKSPIAAEGVSCSFCHSIASINESDADNYYRLDTGGAVYGPYPNVSISGHPIAYSELHRKSELCAGCHEYVNPHGVALLETYSEWKSSPYPQLEVDCQNCHMPIMSDLSIANGHKSLDQFVTAHEFRGGHSKINLAHAVSVDTKARRTGNMLNVEVAITNAESGHKLPTGIPIRQLVLNVTLKGPGGHAVSSARKVYRKALTDQYGTIIENVADMFSDATRIYSDNRIGPKETRVETFAFDLPKWLTRYQIEAVLNYEYSRPVLTEETVQIEMARNLIDSRDDE